MNTQQQLRILQAISNAGLFRGITKTQAASVLSASTLMSYSTKTRVYSEGSKADELLILLCGKLQLVGPSGKLMHGIHPGQTVGDFEVLAGGDHPADVIATTTSRGLAIGISKLREMFKADPEMELVVLRNAISTCAGVMKKTSARPPEVAERAVAA